MRQTGGSVFTGSMTTSHTTLVEVVSPTVVKIGVHNWSNRDDEVISSVNGTTGRLSVEWDPGVAVEHMVELSNEVGEAL